MLRKIIEIDEAKCNGCGDCLPNCPEGALQIIDGKARMVSELMCDGLGVCLQHCPQGAITIREKEAQPYKERQVMAKIISAGPKTIRAHLQHLRGKALIIACPKLDGRQEVYLAKLKALIDQAAINTLTVMIMEVPCCGGLLNLACEARQQSHRKAPIKLVRVGLKGEILEEEWVEDCSESRL